MPRLPLPPHSCARKLSVLKQLADSFAACPSSQVQLLPEKVRAASCSPTHQAVRACARSHSNNGSGRPGGGQPLAGGAIPKCCARGHERHARQTHHALIRAPCWGGSAVAANIIIFNVH